MPSFVHAPLLWGLLLAGVPVLIHLINMLQQRRVPWAAMEFLVASQKKHRTWVLLKQLVLLALRMAAVAAVVLMVAQPLLPSQLGRWITGAETHHVVLLDDSFSMSDRWDDTSVFEQGKRVVEQIGRHAARQNGQTFTLLRFSQASRAGRPGQPDFLYEGVDQEFPGRLQTRLNALEVSETAAGPVDALEAASQILGPAQGRQQVVYLISDFRARQWENASAIRRVLGEWAEAGVKIHLVPCAEQARPNLAIRDLGPGPGLRAAGVPWSLEITVENFGPAPAEDVAVLVEADGLAQPALSIPRIPPRQTITERLSVRLPTAGEHRFTARLEPDAVLADNFRYAVVDLPASLPVLLLDGDPQAHDARYLQAVFSPGGPVPTGISPRIEPPHRLAAIPLEPFAAIYLLNVDRLDAPAVSALERYVADGGGVALFLGERCQVPFLNDQLYRNGQGLLPVPIAGPAELLPDYLERALDLEVAEHPIFQVFSGDRNSFLALVMVRRYFAVAKDWQASSDPAASVLARLRNGAPLVVERRYGRGRVVAFLTTAAPVWNNWARDNPSFVVAMLELQAYLSARPSAQIARIVGSPLQVKLDPAQYEPQVRFLAPREEVMPAALVEAQRTADGQLLAVFDSTDMKGFYRARLRRSDGQEETRSWAVNVDSAEGDLRLCPPTELAARLEGVPYHLQPASAFQFDSEEPSGYNLGTVLLVSVVLLLVAEQLLAYSASYHAPAFHRGMAAGGGP